MIFDTSDNWPFRSCIHVTIHSNSNGTDLKGLPMGTGLAAPSPRTQSIKESVEDIDVADIDSSLITFCS